MAIYDDAEGDSDADSILDCEDGERKVNCLVTPFNHCERYCAANLSLQALWATDSPLIILKRC